MPAQQATRFCFTLNNYLEEQVEALKTLSTSSLIRFMIVGKETAQTGTKHLQGYLELKKKMTITGLKRFLDLETVHLEVSKGTAQQNIDYCSKDQNVVINCGSPLYCGKRSDIHDVKEAIDSGIAYNDLWDSHFKEMVKYHRAFKEYIGLKGRHREIQTKLFVFYGKTGTGKSLLAKTIGELFFEGDIYHWTGERWFDGYVGQRMVIMDEFEGAPEQGIGSARFKQLFDHYPTCVPNKGGFFNWDPEVVVITSNVRPEHWFRKEPSIEGLQDQINRRITYQQEFKTIEDIQSGVIMACDHLGSFVINDNTIRSVRNFNKILEKLGSEFRVSINNDS